MPVLNKLYVELDRATPHDAVMPRPPVAEWRGDGTALSLVVDSCLVATVEMYEDGSPGEVVILPNGSMQDGYDEGEVLEPLDAEYFASAADAVRAVERYMGITELDRDPEESAVSWSEYLQSGNLLDVESGPFWIANS